MAKGYNRLKNLLPFLHCVVTTPWRRIKLMGRGELKHVLGDARRMLGSLRNVGTVSDEVYHARLAACECCPVYDKARSACGTMRVKCVGVDYAGVTVEMPLGCGCHVGTKASIADATCWLDRDEGLVITTEGCEWLQDAISNLPKEPRWPNDLQNAGAQA